MGKSVFLLVLFFLLTFPAAGGAAGEPFTIGLITNVRIHEQTMEGFKKGMSDQGYLEGSDVRYLYGGVVQGDTAAIDAEVERMVVQGVDLLVTMANEVSLRVNEIVGGSGVPILIAGSSRPVEEGLIESLGHPGGEITGVRVADNYAKTLEWLTTTIPCARKVFIPYNPADSVSLIALEGLDRDAAKLGLELVCRPVRSTEEAAAAIEAFAGGVDAIYRIPSPTLDPENEVLSHTAISCGLPMVSCLPLDEAVLLTFASNLFRAGRQTARLVRLIHNGAKPCDLPVETCDADLTINLKTAAALGIHIPDEILLQAKTIIRDLP